MTEHKTMITREMIRETVRTMHHGGCENWLIARAAARCARTLVMDEIRQGLCNEAEVSDATVAIVDGLRTEGWFV